MPTVTVSSKYQVVIPQEIREALKIKPGQKLEFLATVPASAFSSCRRSKS